MCIGGFLRGGGGRCRCLLSHKCLPSHRVPVGMRGVQPGGGVQAQRALLPRCLKCHLLGFNSGDGGVFAESITEGDDVGCVRSGREEKCFRCGVCVSRNERAGEMIRFFRTWRCPTERTEKVVIYDSAVERCGRCRGYGWQRGRPDGWKAGRRSALLRIGACGNLLLRVCLRFCVW